MKRSMVLAAICAMVLLVALLVRSSPDEVPASPTADAPEAAQPDPTLLTPPTPMRAVARTPHWLVEQVLDPPAGLPKDDETSGPDRSGTLAGRLLGKNRRLPLAAVEVALTRSWLDTVLPTILDEEVPASPLLEPRTTTGEDGRFSIHPVPTDGNLFFLIGRGTPFVDFRKVPTLPSPGEEVDLGDLYIEERGRLIGRVVGPEGSGVADVEVRAVHDPFLADPLAAEELRRERNLESIDPRGMVRGELVPDWLARRDSLLPFPKTLTRSDGSFSLEGLRPGRHQVYFRDASRTANREALIAAERTTELSEVRLAAAETLAGHLEYPDGEPVGGAQIAAVSAGWRLGPAPVRANGRGEFRLLGLAAGVPVHLLYRLETGGSWQLLGTVTPDPLRTRRRRFVIARATQGLFHVIDDHGAPVVDARLTLMRTTEVFRREDLRLPSAVQPRALSPGSWTARLGSWTGIRVVATADGHVPAVADDLSEAFEPWGLTLRMLSPFPMRFMVTDVAGNPVAGAEVSAVIEEADWYQFPGTSWSKLSVDPTRIGITNADGVLQQEGFWQTNMVFAASHRDHVTSPNQRIVPSTGLTVRLVLRRPGRIEGFVTEGRQPPPRRWRIVAEPNHKTDHPLYRNPFLRPVTTITSSDGSFSVPDLHPGDWLLRPLLPAAPGTSRQSEQERWLQRLAQPLHLSDGQELYMNLELKDPPGRGTPLAGEVELDGLPAPGLVVRLFYREPSWRFPRRRGPSRTLGPPEMLHSTLTGAGGMFQFFDVPDISGRSYHLTVEISRQGRAQRLGSLQVEAPGGHGEEDPLQIDIRTGSLQCTVLGLDGRVLAGRMLRFVQSAEDGLGAEFVVLSDELGMIRLASIPAGEYEMSLVGDASRKLGDPRFSIQADGFTTRDFLVVEADRR